MPQGLFWLYRGYLSLEQADNKNVTLSKPPGSVAHQWKTVNSSEFSSLILMYIDFISFGGNKGTKLNEQVFFKILFIENTYINIE